MPVERIKPKIGIALSGASGRAVAHIGVLEVLKEQGIPIDYMAGCSSGALIAASYATETMEVMKQWLYEARLSKLMRMWSVKNAKGAIFHLHNAEEEFLKFTKGLNIEDVQHPRLGFVATDLNTGELVTLSFGDMVKAVKASIAVPGLFEPVVWGNKILVDGGLVNVVPTLPVRQMGADIVIGVNLAATRFIYEKKMPIWRGFRFFTRLMGLQFVREKLLPVLSPRLMFRIDSQSDVLEEEDMKIPGVLSVLAKAIDHSFEIEEQWTESEIACDLMLEPKVKHYGKAEFKSLEKIYLEGRRTAEDAIPQIRRLIAAWEEERAVKLEPKLKSVE